MTEILSVILLACFFGLGFVLGKMKGANDIIDEVLKENE